MSGGEGQGEVGVSALCAVTDAMLARAAHAVQRTMVRAKIGAATRDGAP